MSPLGNMELFVITRFTLNTGGLQRKLKCYTLVTLQYCSLVSIKSIPSIQNMSYTLTYVVHRSNQDIVYIITKLNEEGNVSLQLASFMEPTLK